MSSRSGAFNVSPGAMVDSWSRPSRPSAAQWAKMDPFERASYLAANPETDEERYEKLRREVLGLDELDWDEAQEGPDDWSKAYG